MDKIIKKLSKKYNISEFKTELIVKSQFGLLKKAIESGDFKSIRLKHLGIFTVKKNRFNYYNNGRRGKEKQS
jgi:nucleoid DNA-binding protein|tara:strand:- start:576 stop:791 length:216 start_codon:yes stop_codon:yes gene_type:complete